MDLTLFLQVLVNGLLLGGLYGLIATGLSLIFGVMRVINVAHGDMMVLAGTGAFLLYTWLRWPPYVALLVVVPVMFGAGMAVQRLLLERITRAEELMSLLLLFGLGVVISQSMGATVGTEFFSIPVWGGSIPVGGVLVSRSLMYAFGFAVLISAGLFYLLRATMYGRAIRATAMAPELAAATGVDVRRVRVITFGIGTALAGAAGTLLVTSQGVNTLSGDIFLLIAFAACVLGGLGSVVGALVAGFIIALIEVYAAIVFDPQWSQLAIYAAFILTLLMRPAGLFGVRRA